jgi:hypothetical protein
MKILNWFLPSRKNKFHPMALRPIGLIVFLALFVTIPFLYNVTSAQQFQILGYATNVTVGGVHTLSNRERTDVGLLALNLDSQLNSAALAKANDMFTKDYWAHVAPDGTTPWSFIYATGYDYQTAGENLAMGFDTSAGVVAGWMASEHHKENILNTSYVDVGYAAVNGILQGSETTLVVAMYGSRMPADATIPASSTPTPTPTSTQTAPVPEQTAPTEVPTDLTTALAQQPTEVPVSSDATAISQTSQQPAQKEATGIVEGIMSILPIKTYQSFNWGQKASIALVCTMILLFIMKHTLIWRERKYGVKHIWLRSHPIGQASLLTAVLVITMLSSAGTIL